MIIWIRIKTGTGAEQQPWTVQPKCPSALLQAEPDHVVVCLAITRLRGAKLLTRPLNRCRAALAGVSATLICLPSSGWAGTIRSGETGTDRCASA